MSILALTNDDEWEITDSGWKTFPSSSAIKNRVRGGVCYIVIDNLNIDQSTIIRYDVPSEIIPSSNINLFCRAQTYLLQAWIDASAGKLAINPNNKTQVAVAAFVSYPL